MSIPAILVGGVDSAWHCLKALCEAKMAPRLAIGYAPSLADRSGYMSLAELCERYGVPLVETEDINDSFVIARVREAEPAVMVVAGWSQLLGEEILAIPSYGTVGFHPTALPQGRGRAPIPWTLIKGLDRSAVTMFWLTPGVDDGPIVAQEPFEVSIHDDAQTLYDKIRQIVVDLLMQNLESIIVGTASKRPQEGEPSYWLRRRPEDGMIDWQRPGIEVFNWVRGLTHPFPGAFTHLSDGRKLLIWAADLVELGGGQPAEPGTILGSARAAGRRRGGVSVAAGQDSLVLRRVQVEEGLEREALDLFEEGILERGSKLG